MANPTKAASGKRSWSATNLKLDNLTVIYDNNMSHARGLQIPNPKSVLRRLDVVLQKSTGTTSRH
jgi:hypothetical protein